MHHAFYSGGSVVSSDGRLIPRWFPITDLQQIADPSGTGRITCTVSSGRAIFFTPNGSLETGGVDQFVGRNIAALVLNIQNINTFQNRDVYCGERRANHSEFYLYPSASNSIISESMYYTSSILLNHLQYTSSQPQNDLVKN